MAAFMRHVGSIKILTKTPQLFIQASSLEHSIGLHTSARRCFVQCINGRSNLTKTVFTSKKLSNKQLPWISLLGIRYNSDTTKETASATTKTSSLPEGGEFIPEPPAIPGADVTGETTELLRESLNALGEPTFVSLGLANWTPAGFVQSALETLHVTCGLAWWEAIVLGTCTLRMLIFPLVIKSQKNAAKMNNHMPTVQALQQKFTEARASGNVMASAKAGNELMDYMKRNDISPLKNFLVPLAQLPIFVSVFYGIRKMANLPVESLTTGGISWFTDLTIPDPYYILPFLTMATFLVTIEIGVDGIKASSTGMIMKYFMRAMPFVIFPFISNFPAAMLCYWMTSNIFSLFQVSFLKIPKIRKMFGIELLVKHPPSLLKKKGFRQGVKETWNNSKMMAKAEERAQVDSVMFRKAGVGPIQKTYSFDPTKVKQAIKAKQK